MRFRTYLSPGLAALRRYWKAFVAIQAGALLIVVGYFTWNSFAAACEWLAEVNRRGGVWAAAGVSAVAGGLLPELAKAATGAEIDWRRWRRDVGFNVVFFAVSGAAVFVFYALQARVFGTGNDWGTLGKKVAVDQFVFSVFWSTPFGLTAYALHQHHYNVIRAWPDINPMRIVVKAPSLLLPTWAFWLPMVTMVYSMPVGLQFPLFACALAAWSLLLVFIATPAE